MRTKLATLLGLCVIAGAVGYIALFREQRSELTAMLKADGAFVLADLSRVFGAPGDGGRAGPAVTYPLDVTDVGRHLPTRAFDRVLRFRASAYDLVSRANYALSRRGYDTDITVIHSGEGTFGDARKAPGVRFSIVSGDLFKPGQDNFRLTGFLPR